MIDATTLQTLSQIALIFPAFIIIFTFKGFFKSLVAKLVGDDTAEQEGFLSLNPFVHIDPTGFLILIGILAFVIFFFSGSLPRGFLLLVIVLFGIRLVIPVPVDDRNFRSYRFGGVVTSLADFIASIILTIIAILLMKCCIAVKLPSNVIITFLELCNTAIDLSIMLSILNLIPIPPLNGGRLLRYLLPESCEPVFDWLDEYAFFIIILILFAPGISDASWHIISSSAAYVKQVLFSLFF